MWNCLWGTNDGSLKKTKTNKINTRLATNEIFYLQNIFTKSNSGLLQKSGYNWINLANNVEG